MSSQRIQSRRVLSAAAVATLGLAGSSVSAATLYWDVNGTSTSPSAFAGNTVSANFNDPNWSTDSGGASATDTWNSYTAETNHAHFKTAGTNFAATLTGNFLVNGLTASTGTGGNTTVTLLADAPGRTFTFENGSTVTTGNSRNFIFQGLTTNTVAVSGNITKAGVGRMVFAAGSSYAGTATIAAGDLAMTAITMSTASHFVVDTAGTLAIETQSPVTIGSLASLSSSTGGTVNSNSAATARLLKIEQNSNTTFAGTISANGNSGSNGIMSIEKAGTGRLRLTGPVNHDGGTSISGGTLLINGVHTQNNNGGSNNPGAVANMSVATARLGGTGSVNLALDHKVIALSGSTIAPGDINDSTGDTQIGTLTINFAGSVNGGFEAQSGARLQFDLAAPGNSDLLQFTNINVDATDPISFADTLVTVTNVGGLAEGVYTLMRFRDTEDNPTNVSRPTTGLQIDPGFLSVWTASSIDYTSTAGEIRLIVAVPEPASISLLGLAGGLLLARRRTRSTPDTE